MAQQQRLFAPVRSARLALADKPWLTGLDFVEETKVRDHECNRCQLRSKVLTVCMDGFGPKGDLLVVGSTPTTTDDSAGTPIATGLTRMVQDAVAKHYEGEARYTYAVACHAPRDALAAAAAMCRPYLAHEFDAHPKRVVAMGDVAAHAITGRSIPLLHLRRAWAVVRGVPVLMVMHPGAALHNRIVRKWWDLDMKWALTTDEAQQVGGDVRVLLTEQEVEDYCASLNRSDLITYDVENSGQLWYPTLKLLCIGMCQDPEHPIVIPGDVAAMPRAVAALRAVLEDPTYPKGNQAIKYDRHVTYQALGVDINGVAADSLIWNRLRESDSPAKLDDLAWLVGMGGYKEAVSKEAEKDERGSGKDYGKIDPDTLHLYNGRDTSATWRVIEWQRPRMRKFMGTWQKLVGPAQDALGWVERWGAKLSEQNVRVYDRWLTERFERVKAKLYQHPEVKPGLNLSSDKQVRELLFKDLKLPVMVETESGAPSVGADALKALSSMHPIVALLVEYNGLEKQLSTYGLSVLKHVGYDGRVHSTYGVVRSGRLSSKKPNMQNVTSSGEAGDEGTWARGCWVAEPGNILVNLDFSQMELRVAAMLSGDEEMAATFESGHDYHKATAALIFDVPIDMVTKGQRSIAKNINFGLVYGQTDYGLGMALGIPKERAAGYIEALLGKLKKLGEWRRKMQAQARVSGESWAIWEPETLGWVHRRNIWQAGELGDSSEARRVVKHAMNVSLNNPVQNVANCFSLASLTEAVRWILDEQVPAKLVVTVHDSLMFECPEARAIEVAAEAKRIMTQWPSGIVKLKVDVEAGYDWGHMGTIEI